MDRFDEMRVKGINTNDATAIASDILQGKTAYAQGKKVTGTLVPSGGSTGYNVFTQVTEPETKNGIWIKGGETSGTYFGAYFTKKGNFIENSGFGYLDTTSIMLGQVIIGDYLYVFGTSKESSYKYNLRTKTMESNINVPSFTPYTEYVGAVYYAENDEVYVFYRKYRSSSNYDFKYYIYYPSTDTYSSVGQTMNSYTGYMYNSAPHLHNGKIYIYYVNRTTASYSGCSILDLSTKTSTYKTIGGTNYVVSSHGVGKYIYILGGYNGHDLYRYDCDANTLTYLKDIYTDTYGYADGVFATGNKVYIFYGSSTTPIYRIYDVETGTLTDVVPNISYTIDTGKTDDKQKLFFDPTEGLLYFRSPNFATSVFQFEDSPSLAGLETGTAVIIQDLGYVRPVVIQDISNLQIGVQDVFIMNSDGELDGDLIVYLGNGTEWSLLKGRVKVTFDSDGGSEVSSVSVKYGETVSAPTIPSKDGYEFVYWTLNGSEYDFSTPVTENITLVAEWTEINPTFVDYIESTGTQYIDTGFVPNQDTRIEFSARPTPLLAQKWVYGSRTSSDDGDKYCFYIESAETGAVWYQYYAGEKNDGTTVVTTNINISNSDVTFKTNKNVLYINDTIVDTRDANEFDGTYPITLFALNNGGTIDNRMFSGKFYSCQIYDNGTLVRDFKPCKDTHGVYCLYDAVSNRYFYNAGTGAFTGEGAPTQLINYQMLYDGSLGESGANGANVCASVTGGYEFMIAAQSVSISYNSSNIYINSTSAYSNACIMTNNSIGLSEYRLLCGYGLPETSGVTLTTTGVRDVKGFGSAGIANSKRIDTETNNTIVSNVSGSEKNNQYIGHKFMYDTNIENISSGYPCFSNYSDLNGFSKLTIYSMFLIKQDNWQELCVTAGLNSSTYTDEVSLCADSTAISTILNNEEAVEYMIYNCTGTFMYYFIRNSNCLTALNNSTYKTLIQANEHWNKFLTMIAG